MAPMAIMGGIGLLSAGFKIAGAFQASNAAKAEARATADALEYNAQQTDELARQTWTSTLEDERRLRVMARKTMGGMTAAFGASGIQQRGTVLDIMAESIATAEMDAQTIKQQGWDKASSLYKNAAMERLRAKYALEAGSTKSSAILMGGIGGAVADAAGSTLSFIPNAQGDKMLKPAKMVRT